MSTRVDSDNPMDWNFPPPRSRALAVLVLIFLALGSIYSVVTPIFEAGDEIWHYPFVQYLATTGQLPVQDPARKAMWEQEGGQPPVYYALAAAATFWIDTRDLEQVRWVNPYARIGIPLAFGNKNLVVHTSAENFPWRGTTFAVHLIRIMSLLMSAGSVIVTYLLARETLGTRFPNPSPEEREEMPILAAALVAFNPMFLFISASVNNDALATLLASLALFLIIQLVTRGATPARVLAIGIVTGLGALTKESDLALIPLALLVAAWLAWRAHDPKLILQSGVLIGIPALLIAGWWYARNFLLYGDPLALNVWLKIAGGRATPATLPGLVNEFQGFRISFWGNFGGVNLIAPEWVYAALDFISLVALVGLGLALARKKFPEMLWIPALWLGIIFASLIRWTLLTYASQGRLIFPAISAVGILLAFGLEQFTFHVLRLRKPARAFIIPYSAALFLFAFALATPFLIIAPAYALPARLTLDAAAPNPVHISFRANNAQPELVGAQVARTVDARDELPLTLYWRTPEPIDDDLYVYIHLYDAAGKAIGQWDALPGNGLYPARLWQPDQIIVDQYRVPVMIDSTAPAQVGRVEAGLARVGTTIPLSGRDPSGQEITPVIGQFKIAARPRVSSARPARFLFGDALQLIELNVTGTRGISQFQVLPPRAGALDTPLAGGDLLRIEFTFRALAPLREDYTLFVHLLDAQGRIIAQQDAAPRGVAYPTSFWEAGEEVADQIELSVPASGTRGDYQIEFGLYRARDGARLTVSQLAADEWRAAGDHLLLAPIR